MTREKLLEQIEHASHLLSSQGPIRTFIHHNTLHGFEELSFEEALAKGKEIFGGNGYLSDSEFRKLYRSGRIEKEEIEAAIERRFPEQKFENRIRLTCLMEGIEFLSETELKWRLQETDDVPLLDSSLPQEYLERLRAFAFQILKKSTERIGVDWTISDWIDSFLQNKPEAGVCARIATELKSEINPTFSPVSGADSIQIYLDKLQISKKKQAAYLECVSRKTSNKPELQLAWLASEFHHLSDVFFSEFGMVGGYRDIISHFESHPNFLTRVVLWRTCLKAAGTPSSHLNDEEIFTPGKTIRDLLLELTGEDLHQRIDRVFIPYLSAFLDDGAAAWAPEQREHGFYQWWKNLNPETSAPQDALDCLLMTLKQLAVPDDEWHAMIERMLLHLPGWAGMVNWRADHPQYPSQKSAPIDLIQFLAVRVYYEARFAEEICKKTWNISANLDGLKEFFSYRKEELQIRKKLFNGDLNEDIANRARYIILKAQNAPNAQRKWKTLYLELQQERVNILDAWHLFRIASRFGWFPNEIEKLSPAEYQSIYKILSDFKAGNLSPVWQEAYEAHYRDQILNAIHFKSKFLPKQCSEERPKIQAVFCMDDREESIRRYVEEASKNYQTLGTAGFFGVAMYFQGVDEERNKPLCPAPVTPQHEVVETAVTGGEKHKKKFKRLKAARELALSARPDPLPSFLMTPLMGLISPFLLVGKILLPRTHRKIMDASRSLAVPVIPTKISMPFTLTEQADRIENALKMMGLTRNFGHGVVLLGHGSESKNNPHLGAYDCGACGGNHGGPNARAFAMMANHPEVRAILKTRGLIIPSDTWFLGAEHNTCSEEITCFDLELIPTELKKHFDEFFVHLKLAQKKSAIERCRRFKSAPNQRIHQDIHSKKSHELALRHVEGRTLDFSQARPELGHATNAIAIVGRRSITKGLFLDRRSFLISYDPTIDADGLILERILLAAAPVGAGISLEYYFSTVDNQKYGCDSKLAQNMMGLIGVIEGSQSDLRTGLPRQMIEIHEPMRLQMAVEARPEILGAIYSRQPVIQTLLGKQWAHLISIHPETAEIVIFDPHAGAFKPWTGKKSPLPTMPSSLDWIKNKFEPLSPAMIDPLSAGKGETYA